MAAKKHEESLRIEEFKKKYALEKVMNDQYYPTSRERAATQACAKAYAEDKSEALSMLEKAYKEYPQSPYVLQEHVMMFLQAGKISEAEEVFSAQHKKYPNQVSLKLIGEYLPKFKSSEGREAHQALRMQMTADLWILARAMGSVRIPASK